MTTLISWTGVDQRGPSSLYLAADSRFTWESGETWDFGRKLFASRSRPDILGYCGDVVFASQTLGQVLDLLDGGLMPSDEASTPEQRLASIAAFLRRAFESYPAAQQRPFSALYATRLRSGFDSSFVVMEVSWSRVTTGAHLAVPALNRSLHSPPAFPSMGAASAEARRSSWS
jgi:hypothetical protein